MDFRVINCRGCGRLFSKTDKGRLCPECVKALEEKFFQVREYIRENKGASIIEVSRENEVSVEQIKEWIREDRIELDSATDPDFCCMTCGVPIKSGKYCEYCKKKMVNQLSGVYVQKQPTQGEGGVQHNGERMRFLQK
ncbi:MAG: flagellar protein [Lachnospiraceae bacterium]|nr:flagellar protein [Lachnospiraceae bacterium]